MIENSILGICIAHSLKHTHLLAINNLVLRSGETRWVLSPLTKI